MRVLVEVHDESELERALNINPEIVGVNSRNLKTLEIDLSNFRRLIPQIPDSIYRIAESGIATRSDVQIARDSGADAILVGESLVRAGSPESAIQEFLSVAKS
jgi:indole-3-glycerol phosphate synthase